MGSSLAGYFGVFHRLLASRLKEVPAASASRLAAIAQVGKSLATCDVNPTQTRFALPNCRLLGSWLEEVPPQPLLRPALLPSRRSASDGRLCQWQNSACHAELLG